MDWKYNDKKVLDPSAAIIKEQVSPEWRLVESDNLYYSNEGY